MNFLLMILKDWKLATMAVLTVCLITITFMWKMEKARSEKLLAENAVLSEKILVKEAEIKNLTNSIKNQNTAVDNLNKKLKSKQEELNILTAYYEEYRRINSEETTTLATHQMKVEEVFITTPCGDKVKRNSGTKEANETWKLIKSRW